MEYYRPKYHFTAKKNWINDPVGLCYFKDEYHMYFQYFPYGCEWGTMHWGHATSKDMLEWREKDIALFPSILEDMNGVFSGTSFIESNKMNVFYTGVQYIDRDPKNIHVISEKGKFISSQIHIQSEDGYNFDNFAGKKVIVPPIEDALIGSEMHTRDPLIIKEKDCYYLFLGTQVDDKTKLLIYKSSDMKSYEIHIEYDFHNLGTMLECPSLVTLENKQILIFSPENYNDDNINYPSNCGYVNIKMDLQKGKFNHDGDFNLLDEGYDIYAAQSFVDKEGRNVYIAWIRTPRALKGYDYRGLMTYPRVLNLVNDKLYQTIHPNVGLQFSERVNKFEKENSYKIEANLHDGELCIVSGVRIFVNNGVLLVDRSDVFGIYPKISRKFTIGMNYPSVNLEIFYEPHVLEIYINNGEKVFTNYIEEVTDEFKLPNNKACIYKKR